MMLRFAWGLLLITHFPCFEFLRKGCDANLFPKSLCFGGKKEEKC